MKNSFNIGEEYNYKDSYNKMNKNALNTFPSKYTYLLSVRNSKNKLNRKIYKQFSYKLFEYNQKLRQNSVKNLQLQIDQFKIKYSNANDNLNKNKLTPISIGHYLNSKNIKKKTPNDNIPLLTKCFSFRNKTLNNNSHHHKLIIKNSSTRNQYNHLDIGLVPLKTKKEITKSKSNIKNYCLSDEDFKVDNNNLKYKQYNKQKFKKDKNINFNNIANKYNNNNTEDNYSDCESIKGLIIEIKQKISENRYKVNKTFNDFDKQILQDQYLIERFYEMKKNSPNKNNKNSYFRKKYKKD
mgnify:CR=1 FL=1